MLGILHISDIHAKEDSFQLLNERFKAVQQVVNVYQPEISRLLVIISGDISYSGKLIQFEIIEQLLKEFDQDVNSKGIKTNYLIVPGNHDNNFTPDGHNCKQSEYSAFVTGNFFLNKGNINHIEQVSIVENEKKININLLNSALECEREVNEGEVSFPVDQLNSLVNEGQNSDYSLTIMHHPINWFSQEIRLLMKKKVERITDILFIGHEHIPDVENVENPFHDSHVLIIKGNVFYNNKDKSVGGFNFIRLDLEERKYTTDSYKWDPIELIFCVDNSTGEKSLETNKYRTKNQYRLKPDFFKFLESPDAPYLNGVQGEIRLKDIFVYPRITYEEEGTLEVKNRIKRATFDIDFVKEKKRLFVNGGDKYGKTAAVKTLFMDLYNDGYIPLFIRDGKFKKLNRRQFKTELRRLFTKTYSTPDVDRYFQSDISKRVLILDDFHKINLNSDKKNELLNELLSWFGIVIITARDDSNIGEQIIKKTGAKVFFNYTKVRLVPFGAYRKAHLINKWFENARPEGFFREEDYSIIKFESERIIDTLLDKKVIPALPMFIIIILQDIYANKGNAGLGNTKKFGSYGYLYESFITLKLYQTIPENLDIDTISHIMSLLAFECYQSERKSLTTSEADKHIGDFLENKGLIPEIKDIKQYLLNVGMLEISDTSVKFKYSFILFYYLARYIIDNKDNSDIKELIKGLASEIHEEDHVSLIQFISYQAKPLINKEIAKAIIDKANILFPLDEIIDLKSETEFLETNNIYVSFELPPKEPKELREKRLKFKEKMEEERELLQEPTNGLSELDENIDKKTSTEVTTLRESILGAMNTIKLLGELLGNLPATLDIEIKEAVIQSYYDLMTRMITHFLRLVKKGSPDWVNEFATILEKEENYENHEEAKEFAMSLHYIACVLFIYSLLGRGANAISHRKAIKIFDQVLSSNKDVDFISFLDFTIRVYPTFGGLSSDLVKGVKAKYYKSNFMMTVMRLIAYEYLCTIEIQHSTKQQICSLLEIKPPLPLIKSTN